MSDTKRAIINGGIFSFILAAIGLYQGETLLTAVMVWIFAWVVMSGAFWFSYRITKPKTESQKAEQTQQNEKDD